MKFLQHCGGADEAGERAAPPCGLSAGDVQLDPVTVHGWRVSDRRLPARHPSRLLAFIEWRCEVFEVMQLGLGFEWHQFETVDEAIAHVVATSPSLAQQRLQGELSWLR